MMKKRSLGVVGLVVGLLLVGAIPAAQAATLSSITAYGDAGFPAATCDAGFWLGNYTITGVTDDGGGNDAWGVAATDANGVPLSAFTVHTPVGATEEWWSYFGIGSWNSITARPITVRVFDTTVELPGANTLEVYGALTSGTELGRRTFDPAENLSVCASLPLISGPDMVAIPSWAVVGMFVVDTPIYWAPQAGATSTTVMQAGKTVWVFGVDASGAYYQAMLAGKIFWVPVGTMGPNPDAVWNNRPLPTQVVK